MKRLDIKDTFGELLEAEIESQRIIGSDFRACDAFKYFDTIDKSLTIDEALNFIEAEALKDDNQIPFWIFIAMVHQQNTLKPKLYKRFQSIMSLDKSGKVSRISESLKARGRVF